MPQYEIGGILVLTGDTEYWMDTGHSIDLDITKILMTEKIMARLYGNTRSPEQLK